MKKKKAPSRGKQKPTVTAAKAALAVLTAIYPAFMCGMTGAGLIANKASYGGKITALGAALIASGALMTAAACLCCASRRRLPNLLAMIFTGTGFGVCMFALAKLVRHARRAGWTGFARYEGVPVADMYLSRILPTAAPFLLTAIIAAAQYFSCDRADKRPR